MACTCALPRRRPAFTPTCTSRPCPAMPLLALRCVVRLEAHVAGALGIATPSFPAGAAKLKGAKDSVGRPLTVVAPAPVPASAPSSTPTKSKPDAASTPVPRTPSGAGAATGGTGTITTTEDGGTATPLDDMVLLAADLHALASWFTQCFAPHAAEHRAGNDAIGGDAAEEAASKLRGTREAVWPWWAQAVLGASPAGCAR